MTSCTLSGSPVNVVVMCKRELPVLGLMASASTLRVSFLGILGVLSQKLLEQARFSMP